MGAEHLDFKLRGLEVPGEQFVDAAVGVSNGARFERGLEPGVGLDPVQLGRLGAR